MSTVSQQARHSNKHNDKPGVPLPLTLSSGIRYMLALWLRHRPQALLLLLVLFIYESYKTFFSLTLRSALDSLQTTGRVPNLGGWLGTLLAVVVLAFGARWVGERIIAQVGTNILNHLRRRMFEHVQRLSQSYFARTPIGEILARFSSDLAAVERGTTNQLRDGVLDGIELLLNVPVLFYLDWRLALLATVFVVLLTFVINRLAARATTAGYGLKTVEAQMGTVIQENTRAQALIRAFGFEPLMLARFEDQLTQLAQTAVKATFRRAQVSLAAKAMLALARIVVAGAGLALVMRNSMTIGDLVAFLGLLEIVTLAVDDFSRNVLPDLITATSGLQRIEELLQQTPDAIDLPQAVAAPPLARQICLDQVSFTYTGDSCNLQEINLTIQAGQFVAFVGPSGSGKSTLLSLLMRAHTPTTGRVLFDDVDMSQVTRASLQQQMGVVFQDTYLFNTTIRDNIRMAQPEATDAMVEEAARLAEIHDLIMTLPDQYDTPVGEAGGWLSGGQRQRIAIARAIMRNPTILILDEATSALDPSTEAAINGTLQRLAQSKTVIAVTHRLTSVTQADHIFVMNGGRVVESGAHTALLQQGGLYAQLWQKQSGFEVSADGRQATVHAAYLRHVSLFATLDMETLALLSRHFSPEHRGEGEIVFRQGEVGDKLYLIARGQVEVLVWPIQGADRQQDAMRRIDTMQDGDHFGEMALLYNVPRNATIRTLTECLFLTLPKGEFLKLVQTLPAVRTAVASQVDRNRANRARLHVESVDRNGMLADSP